MVTHIAFRPNEHYDRDQASDGLSRYGAYLAQKRGMFRDLDNDQPTEDALEFSAAAWEIAQSPIMSPGYVTVHPRIQSADATWDDEHRLAIAVAVARDDVLMGAQLLRRARGWAHDRISGGWYDPQDCAVLTALCLVTIRVPILAGDLPLPEFRDTIPVTVTAKAAVAAICTVLNPVVSAVLDG
ncbi:hypothetical protein JOF56_011001 [Kibdelosporangium banguiense]|uniref:Uncharacterized protein n=1 Tax=Kibdelosporangium banguiense TaxID=1365924 RepID=A0ABS4U1X7_9PSEU|nr:hypothetical protein [Kibdelosporangium banguiense]MBP2330616.1 hypothetical protein [Kibdelosporangium banguiense]